MKLYLISLILGVLVGVIYGLFGVRSPAPPVIALVGLAGILIGEQAVPLAKQWIAQEQIRFRTASADVSVQALDAEPIRATLEVVRRAGVTPEDKPKSSQ